MDVEPPKCMIMDDEELAAMTAKCMDWRKDASFDVKGLFQPIKPSREFPKAFQTYRDVLCSNAKPFSFAKPVATRPLTKYVPLVDLSENFIATPESIVEFGVPLIPMPDLIIPDMSEVPAAYVDADGDYLYAPMTPPPAAE